MKIGAVAASRRRSAEGRCRASRARQRGFTLVEIAIIAVIAGLLIGFIVQGQALVLQARMKDLGNELSGANSAFLLYIDRYRALPGDDPLAGTRWAGAVSGNGDRQISGNYNDVPPANVASLTIPAGETLNFWWHLRRAGLVTDSPTSPITQPVNAVGGRIGIQGSGLGFGFNVVCIDGIPGDLAVALDSSLDDGKPDKGMLRAAVSPAPGAALGAVVTAYNPTTEAVYVLCRPIDR
jgi:hypothetical protein